MKLRARAVTAALRLEFVFVAEGKQGVRARVNAEDHTAAAPAVAAVRSARRHILLAAEGDRAVSAVARLQFNFCLVDKHGQTSSPFMRITSLIGVPTNPNVSRRQFSIKRWYEKWNSSTLLQKITKVGGATETCVM